MYMVKQRVKSVQRIFLNGKRHNSENMYLQYIGRGKKCQSPFEVSKYSLTSNLTDTCQSKRCLEKSIFFMLSWIMFQVQRTNVSDLVWHELLRNSYIDFITSNFIITKKSFHGKIISNQSLCHEFMTFNAWTSLSLDWRRNNREFMSWV